MTDTQDAPALSPTEAEGIHTVPGTGVAGQVAPMGERHECHTCAHAGCDPDGPYCGHPKALKRSIFGLSFNVMRGPCLGMPEGPCGSAGKLWEPRNG